MAGRKKVVATKAVDAAVKSVEKVDVKRELDAIAEAQLAVQNTLSALGAKVTDRVNRIGELDLAISAKVQEIKDLHELSETLEDREEVQREITELEESYLERKVRLEKEFTQKAEDLKSDHSRRVKILDVELADRKAAFDKDLTAKNADLSIREKVLKDLQAAVDEAPKREEAAEKRGAAIAEGKLKREFEHASKIAALEGLNELNTLRTQLENALAKNAELAIRNAELSQDLVNVRREANEVVKEVVQANSGKDALTALKESMRNESTQKTR